MASMLSGSLRWMLLLLVLLVMIASSVTYAQQGFLYWMGENNRRWRANKDRISSPEATGVKRKGYFPYSSYRYTEYGPHYPRYHYRRSLSPRQESLSSWEDEVPASTLRKYKPQCRATGQECTLSHGCCSSGDICITFINSTGEQSKCVTKTDLLDTTNQIRTGYSTTRDETCWDSRQCTDNEQLCCREIRHFRFRGTECGTDRDELNVYKCIITL